MADFNPGTLWCLNIKDKNYLLLRYKEYYMDIKQRINKEKLENAILFFTHPENRIKYVGELKIYKLLFFLDSDCFKKIGLTVTGMKYKAYEKGPVPEFLSDGKPFLKSITTKMGSHFPFYVAKKKPNMKVFKKIEQEIMKDLAFIFKEANCEQMFISSHLKDDPWGKRRKQSYVDYYDILKTEDCKVDKYRVDFIQNAIKEMDDFFDD
jgi:hypothetical protein